MYNVSRLLVAVRSGVSLAARRNMGACSVLMQKSSDPIQQLFLDKLKEYKSKSSGGKLVEPSPEIEREWKQELERLSKMFGGDGSQDMSKFPDFKFEEPKIDPINMQESQ